MSRYGIGAGVAVAVLALGACDSGPSERAELRITGDSAVAIITKTFDGEVIGADCASSFRAEVEGSDSAFVVLRGGTIEYAWDRSGQPITTYEWTQDAAHQLWSDTIIRAGQPRESAQHGFGQSVPPQDVRASVVFTYSLPGDRDVRETEPFTFVCRKV